MAGVVLLAGIMFLAGRAVWPGGSDNGTTGSLQEDTVLPSYDAHGRARALRLKGLPTRVLVTYPGVTELMIRLGIQKYVLRTAAPYGEETPDIEAVYKELNYIGAPYIPSREEVLEDAPDLVIGWAHNFTSGELGSVDMWNNFGIPAYIVPGTLPQKKPTLENSVYPLIADLGRIFNISERTDAYIAACRERVSALQKRPANEARPTAIILQEHGKGSYSLYGENYLINDVVQKAGLKNLVKNQISFSGPERVLSFDPDYLIYVSLPGKDGRDQTDEAVFRGLANNADLSAMRAVRTGNVINIPFAQVNSGNDRLIDVLEKIAGTVKVKGAAE